MRATVFLFLDLLLFFPISFTIDVKLVIGDSPVRIIDLDRFLSFTFDTSFIRGNFCSIDWLNAILLVRALTPCYMRLGGNDSDFLIYYPDSPALHGNNGTNSIVTIDANGCAMFARSFFNMSNDRFDRINWFVQSTGVNLMYDFNIIEGRSNKSWNPENTILLLNYAHNMGYAMDFELGNANSLEPDDFPNWYNLTVDGRELAENYEQLRKILNKYQLYRKSKLIGPAIGSPYSQFLQAGGLNYIDAVTFHHYYGGGAGRKLDFFVNPKVLDSLGPKLKYAVKLVKKYVGLEAKRKPIWLGETASTSGGGTFGISDTYAAGFMWLDKLGLCAINGIDAVFRHTFFMGNYAMTDNRTMPNPDYWLSLLYKTIVTRQVLTMSLRVYDQTESSYLRFYAHGNVTHTVLYGMNLLNNSITVNIDGWSNDKSTRIQQYLLEPFDNLLTSKIMLLNGKKLIFDRKKPPSLIGTGIDTKIPLKIPGKRYGFWTLERH